MKLSYLVEGYYHTDEGELHFLQIVDDFIKKRLKEEGLFKKGFNTRFEIVEEEPVGLRVIKGGATVMLVGHSKGNNTLWAHIYWPTGIHRRSMSEVKLDDPSVDVMDRLNRALTTAINTGLGKKRRRRRRQK